MFLKICDENVIFNFTHAKYFDILCYFVILFFFSLCFLLQKDDVIKTLEKHNFSKILIIVSSSLFVGFFVFLFVWFLSGSSYEGCSCEFKGSINFKTKTALQEITDTLKTSKVIIVGDSRMSLIEDDEDIETPFNVEFIAKSGMKISWFEETALKEIDNTITDNYQYHIVINMGVNDLNSDDYEGDDIAEEYFALYQELAEEYPDAKIYLLSVNPVDEDIINDNYSTNKRTNEKIELYNEQIQESIEEAGLDNIYYCDSYNTLTFETNDGLHYTQDTNRQIVSYILNNCVQY